jgi:hypothetical protein
MISMIKGRGRPRKYDTSEDLMDAFDEYVGYCKSFEVEVVSNKGDIVKVGKPRVATLGGFCNYAGIDYETLNNYEKKEGYEHLFGTIKSIKQNILSGKLDSLTNGEGSTTGLIFDLKANHGLLDKNTTDLNISQIAVQVVPSPTSLASDESEIKD